MELGKYDISNPYEAKVVSTERLTPDEYEDEVRHIVVEISHPGFIHVEGQNIGVLVPGPHKFGNENHFRLYSIASSRKGEDGKGTEISLCVRRCFYIDDVSGELERGIASNYLCDLKKGNKIKITGPYNSAFTMPQDNDTNLLLIGAGTGIAPFRAFVKHIYEERGGWKGKVRLFYGARTGMEMLYMNKMKNDLGKYYDKETFKAFEALSPRPHFKEQANIGKKLEDNAQEVWEMLNDSKTCVFIAGIEKAFDNLDRTMSTIAGSDEKWLERKTTLQQEERWSELLY